MVNRIGKHLPSIGIRYIYKDSNGGVEHVAKFDRQSLETSRDPDGGEIWGDDHVAREVNQETFRSDPMDLG